MKYSVNHAFFRPQATFSEIFLLASCAINEKLTPKKSLETTLKYVDLNADDFATNVDEQDEELFSYGTFVHVCTF